jgi:uncharacterized protein YbjT (DUF2867 family)
MRRHVVSGYMVAMTDISILVLGATGKTGSRVAGLLTERGVRPVVATRSKGRRFDWHDKDTWATAVAGTNAVYLVDSQDEKAVDLLGEFVDLSVRAGVRRFVLLSARAWEQSTDASAFAAETVVQDSGAGWTVLRPTWFAQNFSELPLLRDPVVRGEVRLPTGSGPEPFVDVRDIAAVAVAALTEESHDGAIYALSGPRLMTFGDAVAEIADETGREIPYVPVSEEEYVKLLVEQGSAQAEAQFAGQLLGSVASGESGYLSDGVQRVLGREPLDFRDYVRETVPSGVWNPVE